VTNTSTTVATTYDTMLFADLIWREHLHSRIASICGVNVSYVIRLESESAESHINQGLRITDKAQGTQ